MSCVVQYSLCVMCRFQHVLCPDFSMIDVKIVACLMCRFMHVLCADLCMCYVNCSPNGLAALRLARFARFGPSNVSCANHY